MTWALSGGGFVCNNQVLCAPYLILYSLDVWIFIKELHFALSGKHRGFDFNLDAIGRILNVVLEIIKVPLKSSSFILRNKIKEPKGGVSIFSEKAALR